MIPFRAKTRYPDDVGFKEVIVFQTHQSQLSVVVADSESKRFGEVILFPVDHIKLTKEQIHKMEAAHGR